MTDLDTDNNESSLPLEQPGRTSNMLFAPGSIYSTPAVLEHLTAKGVSVMWVIAMHCCGLWGELSEEDKQANNAAVKSGTRILSAYDIEGERIWIITEGVDGFGRRHRTNLLLPSEY